VGSFNFADQINLFYQQDVLNISLASWKPAELNGGGEFSILTSRPDLTDVFQLLDGSQRTKSIPKDFQEAHSQPQPPIITCRADLIGFKCCSFQAGESGLVLGNLGLAGYSRRSILLRQCQTRLKMPKAMVLLL